MMAKLLLRPRVGAAALDDENEPRPTPRPPRPPPPLRRSRAAHDLRQHRYTVLVVDDEQDIADSFQACLEQGLPDVRVVTATTGLEALHVLETEPIDVMLTDFRMPGMDGIELLTRAERLAPDVERVVVSAFPLEVRYWGPERHRVTKIIEKPVDAQELVRAVSDALSRLA